MKFIDAGLHCFSESQIVNDTDFYLNDSIMNAKIAREENKKPKKVIEETDEYILFKTGNDIEGTIVLYIKKSYLMDYYIKYKTERHIVFDKTVTQIVLWRRIASPYAANITSRVFFDVLLKEWPTIISDTEQTIRGYEFWVRQMAIAYGKKYTIGIVDTRNYDITIYDGDKNYIGDWLKENDVFGNGPKYKYIRYFISRDESIKDTK